MNADSQLGQLLCYVNCLIECRTRGDDRRAGDDSAANALGYASIDGIISSEIVGVHDEVSPRHRRRGVWCVNIHGVKRARRRKDRSSILASAERLISRLRFGRFDVEG